MAALPHPPPPSSSPHHHANKPNPNHIAKDLDSSLDSGSGTPVTVNSHTLGGGSPNSAPPNVRRILVHHKETPPSNRKPFPSHLTVAPDSSKPGGKEEEEEEVFGYGAVFEEQEMDPAPSPKHPSSRSTPNSIPPVSSSTPKKPQHEEDESSLQQPEQQHLIKESEEPRTDGGYLDITGFPEDDDPPPPPAIPVGSITNNNSASKKNNQNNIHNTHHSSVEMVNKDHHRSPSASPLRNSMVHSNSTISLSQVRHQDNTQPPVYHDLRIEVEQTKNNGVAPKPLNNSQQLSSVSALLSSPRNSIDEATHVVIPIEPTTPSSPDMPDITMSSNPDNNSDTNTNARNDDTVLSVTSDPDEPRPENPTADDSTLTSERTSSSTLGKPGTIDAFGLPILPDSYPHVVKFYGRSSVPNVSKDHLPSGDDCIRAIQFLSRQRSRAAFREGMPKWLSLKVSHRRAALYCRTAEPRDPEPNAPPKKKGFQQPLLQVLCVADEGAFLCYVAGSFSRAGTLSCYAYVFECESDYASRYVSEELVKACRLVCERLKLKKQRDQQEEKKKEALMHSSRPPNDADLAVFEADRLLGLAVSAAHEKPPLKINTKPKTNSGPYYVCCKSYQMCACVIDVFVEQLNEAGSLKCQVGRKVSLNNGLGLGVVKFRGASKRNSDLLIIGIELEQAKGDSDGEFDSERYFTTSENCATFITVAVKRESAFSTTSL